MNGGSIESTNQVGASAPVGFSGPTGPTGPTGSMAPNSLSQANYQLIKTNINNLEKLKEDYQVDRSTLNYDDYKRQMKNLRDSIKINSEQGQYPFEPVMDRIIEIINWFGRSNIGFKVDETVYQDILNYSNKGKI